MREFTDRDGAQWVAYIVDTSASGLEVARRYLPDELLQGWLVFESGERKLRLVPVPAGWADTSDDQLRELLARARPTETTRPSGRHVQRESGADDRTPR